MEEEEEVVGEGDAEVEAREPGPRGVERAERQAGPMGQLVKEGRSGCDLRVVLGGLGHPEAHAQVREKVEEVTVGLALDVDVPGLAEVVPPDDGGHGLVVGIALVLGLAEQELGRKVRPRGKDLLQLINQWWVKIEFLLSLKILGFWVFYYLQPVPHRGHYAHPVLGILTDQVREVLNPALYHSLGRELGHKWTVGTGIHGGDKV